MIRIVMIILISISTSFNSICQADDRAKDRTTLRGIKAIIVKVHSWEPDWSVELKKAGLEESYLQALVERKLEKSGRKGHLRSLEQTKRRRPGPREATGKRQLDW